MVAITSTATISLIVWGNMSQKEVAGKTPQRFEGMVGLHWRTSNRLGAPHHPTVLSLSGGRFSAVTAAGVMLFNAPIEQFSVRFSRWGTLQVSQAGHLFLFVAGSYAGTSARPFSETQQAELSLAGARVPDAGTGFMAGALTNLGGTVATNLAVNGAGAILGLASRAVGTATMFREQFGAFRYVRMWAELLHAAGASVEFSTKSYTVSALSVTAIVVPSLALLTVGVYLLIVAFS